MRCLLVLCLAFLVRGDESFVDVDSDFHKLHRNLLQTDEDDADNDDEPVSTAEQRGPTSFFVEKDGNSFRMTVTGGIKLTVFESGNLSVPIDIIVLDKGARSIMAGKISSGKDEEFQVDINWKGLDFEGEKLKMSSMELEMAFKRDNKYFKLTRMTAKDFKIGSRHENMNDLIVGRTSGGFELQAPLGSSFSCYTPGMFRPKTSTDTYVVGVTLPNVRLQVFDAKKFGPEWDCDIMIPIGLWVGLILSLLFAIVCAYGFSMLASIGTPDRFDDPKGKPIHVPQTD